MKQRIHNSLIAAVRNGKFYRCGFDRNTGQMTIYTDHVARPTGVVVKEIRSLYQAAKHFRREAIASELAGWTWVVQASFSTEVACEIFEQDVVDAGILVPAAIGAPKQRVLLARLVDSSYDHPPEQSPSNGTMVEFTFEIDTTLLRK